MDTANFPFLGIWPLSPPWQTWPNNAANTKRLPFYALPGPFSELLYIVQRTRSCTSIPLSVDLEREYAKDLDTLKDKKTGTAE